MHDVSPLTGRTILVTRSREQSQSFVGKIEELGGKAIVVPLLAFQLPNERHHINKAIESLHTYQWLIFTSANGVHFFFELLDKEQLAVLHSMKIAVVGTKTEEIVKKYGFTPDVVPNEFVAESFVTELLEFIKPGEQALFPRGNLARDVIPNQLRSVGILVFDFIIYETVGVPKSKNKINNLLETKQIDYITFTSPSTVDQFAEVLKEKRDLLHGVKLAGIGPITEKAAMKHNLKLDIIAKVYTTDGLLEAIVESTEEVDASNKRY